MLRCVVCTEAYRVWSLICCVLVWVDIHGRAVPAIPTRTFRCRPLVYSTTLCTVYYGVELFETVGVYCLIRNLVIAGEPGLQFSTQNDLVRCGGLCGICANLSGLSLATWLSRAI